MVPGAKKEKIIQTLFDIVGQGNYFTDPLDKEKYEKGYRYGDGKAMAVLRPQTTEQVSQILKFCNAEKIAVIPQGGNTGLVGSSIPDDSAMQIVLSTQLLNHKTFKLDIEGQFVTVGAGMVLAELNSRLQNNNLSLPIDIGSMGTCNIGGIIATNAAGTRAARYGNAKSRVQKLTVVLANGEVKEVFSNLKNIDKNLYQDNSCIDFDNPFIGSQGWLGVITQATMLLEPIALQTETVVVLPKNTGAINDIRHALQEEFNEKLTAFEGMSDIALKLVAKHIPNTKYLFEDDTEKQDEHNYALLVEVASEKEDENLSEQLLQVINDLMTKGHIVSGLQGKPDLYWHHRHHISEALSKEGVVIATDIAVMDKDKLGEFREEVADELMKNYANIIIAPFGHEMLGALHFNIIWPKSQKITKQYKRQIQEFIYDKVVNKYKGTFSAEHGIGPHNQWAYDKFITKAIKEKSLSIKQIYDPNNILNPNINYGL